MDYVLNVGAIPNALQRYTAMSSAGITALN